VDKFLGYKMPVVLVAVLAHPLYNVNKCEGAVAKVPKEKRKTMELAKSWFHGFLFCGLF